MAQRSVSFYSDGLKLDGVLFLPDGLPEGPRVPGVAICHGFTQHKEIFGLSYAAALVKHGFACLSFDYRGFGGSEGPRGRLIPLEQANDVRSALSFLEAQPEVDPARLGLLGTSFGGANVVYVGAIDQRAKAIVCFDGIGSGHRWFRGQRRHYEWVELQEQIRRDRLNRALTGQSDYLPVWDINVYSPRSKAAHEERKKQYPDWQDSLPLETAERVIEYLPEDLAHLISPRPLLIIYDKNPIGHALEEAEHIYARAREPKRLVGIGPSGRQYSHYFGEELEHWIGLSAEFFWEYLGEDA